jgi:hypothetical protein
MLFSAAETLALKALTRIAGDAGTLERFLSLSGLELADLRERAAEPELLAAVLDFLLGDDELLRDFCATEEIDTKIVHAARRALPGAAPD